MFFQLDAQRAFGEAFLLNASQGNEASSEATTALAWLAAVLLNLASAGFTAWGFALQKRAAQKPARWRIGDMPISCQWFVGVALSVGMDVPCTILAYSLAPMTLTTLMSGASAVVNMVGAPYMLGERVQLWPDLVSCVLILAGTATTAAAGLANAGGDVVNVVRLFERPAAFTATAVLFSFCAACQVLLQWRRSAIEKSARDRPDNPNMVEVVMPAFVSCSWACLSNVALKGLGNQLSAGGSLGEACEWATLLVPSALIQINYMNRGLRLYPQTIFLPVCSALQVILTTLYGAIIYRELDLDAAHYALFAVGLVATAGGVLLFSRRRHAKDLDTGSPQGTSTSTFIRDECSDRTSSFFDQASMADSSPA